jgi:hypothetical protein
MFVFVHGMHYGGWACWHLAALPCAAGREVFAPTITSLGERFHVAHPGIVLDTHIEHIRQPLAYEGPATE